MIPTLEQICRMTQKELFNYIRIYFNSTANVVYCKKNWVWVKGSSPVLLVAHLDTVHKEKVKDVCYSPDGNIIMSPQGIGGDDRCGVYALIKAWTDLSKEGIYPNLLFCCDEEVGGLGAEQFVLNKKCISALKEKIKFIIEIDRKGSKDAVYYNCANYEFEDYITSKGYHTEWGTFSDISTLAPELEVAAVNLSSGYYNAHTQHEYIKVDEIEWTIEKVKEIVRETPSLPRYEYIERIHSYYTGYDKYDYYNTFPAYNDGFYTRYDKFIDKLPAKYEDIYEELVAYYDEGELMDAVEKKGYGVLQELYNDLLDDLCLSYVKEKC